MISSQMPRLIFLTGLTALLSACSGLPKPKVYLIDVRNSLCESYVVTKDNPLTYARSKQPVALSNCNGYLAISPADAAEILRQFRACQKSGDCD